jgi:hypothetical protein
VLGNAWLALPLVPAQVDDGTPTGDQSWGIRDPRLGPFTADLSDGSRVTYAWFRFLDQPVLRARRGLWREDVRRRLQAFVEHVHRSWPIDGDYMPPPSAGELVELDAALLVKPPPGCEVGYVPVALRQHRVAR